MDDSSGPPPVMQVPTLAADIDIDDDKTLGIYLELPTATRRRRSLQPSIHSENDGNFAHFSINEEVFEEDIFDSPRLFTELLTLSESDKRNIVWKEAARWVRFEEDVEEGSMRWSKPRVSTLQLHSFFELRSYLTNGIVCLDIEGQTLDTIFTNVINNSSLKKKLSSDKIKKIQDTLRCNYVHLFEIMKNKESKKNAISSKKIKFEKSEKEVTEDFSTESTGADEEIATGNYKGNRQFMRKLAEGTEAANVFVSEVNYIDKPLCIFVRLKSKVHLGNVTEVPVASRFLFFIMGAMGTMEKHFEMGRSIATLFSDEVFREVAYRGKNKSHLLAGMDEFLDASTLLPPGEWDPAIKIEPPAEVPTKETRKKKTEGSEVDEEEEERKVRESSGLTRTGRLFGGFLNDIKRKAPWYLSDFKDVFSLQSLASFFFLYFACLAPIVTFGGLLGDATNNSISVMESLVAGLVSGVLYGFFSGQPLTILGSTGPVLVFETILHQFCMSWEWNYLSFRLWIGVWAGLILFLLVAFDASALVCYITRFTEENFATLISLIFIVKAIEKVIKIGTKYPMMTNVDEMKYCNCVMSEDINFYDEGSGDYNVTDLYMKDNCEAVNGTLTGNDCDKSYPDVFLLSIMLFVGTFLISTYLKNFKSESFFPTWARNFISDFAVIIAILLMTGIDLLIGIHTPKLIVPSEFKPTSPDRGWLIPPFNGNPWWSIILAIIPAILACILIFMDQQITAVIVNRKEHKLKKGGGYHLDLFIVAILIVINSVMGLPWFVAATVLSINHVDSLKKVSESAAPGEKPQFLGVRENRVTHILIFLAIGFSVFVTPVLRMIPMSVLFGVFLYMGISALKGIQFFERILIMFMPVKYQPDHTYLRTVPLKRVHLFTYIQLSCLVVLWVIKSFEQTSILFPIMLVVMIGVRKMMEFIFTQRELKILDDALPEYKRKEKNEEEDEIQEEETIEEEAKNFKGTRTMSLAYEGSSIINNILVPAENSDDLRKPHVPKASESINLINLRQRRRSSILEPIFTTPHHYEGDPSLRVPGEYEFKKRRRSSTNHSKDALSESELESMNGNQYKD